MRRILCILAGLTVAALCSQAPEFLHQYGQRLGGEVDALQQQAQDFDAGAAARSLTRDQAVDRLTHNADPVAADQGRQRQASFDRLGRLTRDRAELAEGNDFTRFGHLVIDLDRPTARATLAEFTPALPASPEGGLFALLGFLLGLAVATLMLAATMAVKPAPHGYRRKPVRLLR